MPLIRLNDSAFDAQLEGVYFGMWNGSSTVRCFVTRAALTDKAQGSGQAESLDVFHEYRSEIENLASAKYDAGKITNDGLVVVDSPDLNPEQFQQGLAWSLVGLGDDPRCGIGVPQWFSSFAGVRAGRPEPPPRHHARKMRSRASTSPALRCLSAKRSSD
jgi:hypothetical protein